MEWDRLITRLIINGMNIILVGHGTLDRMNNVGFCSRSNLFYCPIVYRMLQELMTMICRKLYPALLLVGSRWLKKIQVAALVRLHRIC